jgi:hypothetical protein
MAIKYVYSGLQDQPFTQHAFDKLYTLGHGAMYNRKAILGFVYIRNY